MRPPGLLVVAEVASGAAALALPAAAPGPALWIAIVGALALATLLWRPTAAARTAVAGAVLVAAFAFPGGGIDAWVDGTVLLLFLALGGWAEAGVVGRTAAAHPRAGVVQAEAVRLVGGVAAVGAVAYAASAAIGGSVVLAIAGMAAGVGALAVARSARH